MNTKHISLAFAAAAALLAGCAKGPIETPSDTNGLTDLELTHVGANESKAAIDGTNFPEEGEIGLFLFKDELAETPYGESGYTNVKYAYNSDKKKWTASPSIKVGNTPGYLFGYYPYKADTQEQPINVKAIPAASSLNGDDVMYAEKVSNVTDATASQTSITMNHALSRVCITVVNKGYTGNAKLSKIKFSGAEIAPEGTLNALDGKITAEKSSVTLDVTGGAQTITAVGTTYECLLVPSDAISTRQDLDLTLTIDGEDKTATLSGDNGVIIAQNTKSNITITLSNKGISIQTVSVEDWNVVEVGGHKVKVGFDDKVSGIEEDVWLMAYAKNGNAVIEAYSKSDKQITCQLDDDSMVSPEVTDNISKFVISVGSKDIVATIGVLGEGGRKDITVDGHKIKVVYDDFEEVEKDVWVMAYKDGNVAKIKAYPNSEKSVVCAITGDATCEKTKADNIYTFTISNITSDITAAIGYQHVTGISLNKSEFVIYPRMLSEALTATIEPDDAANKNIRWSSSKENVATVDDNGTVTPVQQGVTIITATTEDGNLTAECVVTVELEYPVTAISLNRTSVNLAQGWIVSLKATITPDNADIKDVVWSSNQADIVSVDANGKVKAVAQGEATITATASDGTGVTAKCTVSVGPTVDGSLPYEFSVSATKKVHFSQGNLWYDGSTFKFETNQYEFHGYDSESNTWGLFGWSTAATDYGMSTSTDYNGYNGDFIDWGNAIGDGRNWQTLSIDEWNFLINYYNDNDIRRGKYKYGVTVCGKTYCVVLLPDDWEWDGAVGTDWQKGGYPETSSSGEITWKTMEDAGAVCLPTAGQRNGTSVSNIGSDGRYWSSSTDSSGSQAYNMHVVGGGFFSANLPRFFGHSVRLVTDCTGEPAEE